jgi:enoyl-CoA hydratase
MTVAAHRGGPVGWITLDRPAKRNAISAAMAADLHAALDDAEADPDVRVIVLRGAGPAFCAGFDLGELHADTAVDQVRATLTADLDLIMRFWRSPKPTVAAVHGYALGGGFELAMACDVTVAAADAVFGEPEPTFGSGVVALLLPWLTGPKAARELLLFGSDRVPADRALRLGLINDVVARDQLHDAAAAIAQRSALLDPTAVRLTKQAINASYDRIGLEDTLQGALETAVEIETTRTDESRAFLSILERDGVAAALDWRAARVPGADRARDATMGAMTATTGAGEVGGAHDVGGTRSAPAADGEPETAR